MTSDIYPERTEPGFVDPTTIDQRDLGNLERIGDVVSAVCNHEGKASLLLAMEQGVLYGYKELHALFLEIQGNEPVFRGRTTNQGDYCNTFEEVGLVAKSYITGEGVKYELTDVAELGKAIAGASLFAVNQGTLHPRLEAVFGTTNLHGDGRPPTRTLRLMEMLLGSYDLAEIGKDELARRAKIGPVPAGHKLATLKAAGLVEYDTVDRNRDEPSFSILRTPDDFKPRNELGRKCLEFILDKSASANLVELKDLYGLFPGGAPAQVKTQGYVRSLMYHMQRKGYLERRTGRATSDLSAVSLSDEQRDFWNDLISAFHEIASMEPDKLTKWRLAGESIVSSPEKVRELFTRAYSDGARIGENATTYEEKARDIAQILFENDLLTAKEITVAMNLRGYRNSKSAIIATLTKMKAAGDIAPDREGKGSKAPYWSLVKK